MAKRKMIGMASRVDGIPTPQPPETHFRPPHHRIRHRHVVCRIYNAHPPSLALQAQCLVDILLNTCNAENHIAFPCRGDKAIQPLRLRPVPPHWEPRALAAHHKPIGVCVGQHPRGVNVTLRRSLLERGEIFIIGKLDMFSAHL